LKRISKDIALVSILNILKQRSTCSKLQVAALLVTDNGRIISTGYNGTPAGYPHCIDKHPDEPHSALMELHAEHNCLLNAPQLLTNDIEYTELWVTHKPCVNCLKVIVTLAYRLKIKNIYYIFEYMDDDEKYRLSDDDVSKLYAKHGISIICVPEQATV